MNRPSVAAVAASTLLVLGAVLAGCAAPAASAGAVAASSATDPCDAVTVQLTGIGALVEGAQAGVFDTADGGIEKGFAEQLTTDAADLAADVEGTEVGTAYAPVHEALDELADAVASADPSDESAAQALADATAAVEAAGADLIALCSTPSE